MTDQQAIAALDACANAERRRFAKLMASARRNIAARKPSSALINLRTAVGFAMDVEQDWECRKMIAELEGT